ncbi:hypothetical protein V6N13_112742 [Hibiscus sabdariffa]|uniref:Fe2OG dioxygenase domain-containing protein n=1 Tax=Hibiscus sabdariffa TaxID=183260 RepID=A0ABR2TPG0_9ROSI
MERLVSSWYKNKSLPESYKFPPETRPGNLLVYTSKTIPVIDLVQNRADIVRQILKSSEEYGFFQVVNHGVPEDVMNGSMDVFKEFFEMPAEDKATMLHSEDPRNRCRLSTSSTEKVHHWRDKLRHPCHTLQDCIKHWPEKPIRYNLALGLSKHCDPDLITILHQGDVYGLQVFNNGEWIAVEPLHVVNIGNLLQIISNDKLKSVEHRVVTNSRVARTTAAFFISPSNDSIIEPAKPLISDTSVYRACEFKEFMLHYLPNLENNEVVMKHFKLQA